MFEGLVLAGILCVAAFARLYRFAREYFGASVAGYAVAFFAVFPLAIFSSRLVWHMGLLPLFAVRSSTSMTPARPTN